MNFNRWSWALIFLLALACGEDESGGVVNAPATGGFPPAGATGGQGAGGSGTLSPARPFASHAVPYANGARLPTGTQTDLDRATSAFYDLWKASYLRPGCGDGRWYVLASFDGQNLSLSEANGFGMLLSVLMAGYDPDARTHFDGLVRFHQDHPTTGHPELMAWYQGTDCATAGGAKSSTDADLDEALALLMADTQWGSCGAIDYRGMALGMLRAILAAEVDPTGSFMLMSDELPPNDAITWTNASRSADFMPGDFAAFGAAASDGASFAALLERGYGALSALQATYASTTGLLPDLFLGPWESPQPAPDRLDPSGAPYHNDAYFYNAGRVPWRVGTHAAVAGDERARTLIAPLSGWFATNTQGDPTQVGAGYALDGTSLGADYTYPTMAFIAPLGVAAMSDSGSSAWLDALWRTIRDFSPEAYYEDSVKLLAMLVMSGNWWAPDAAARPCTKP